MNIILMMTWNDYLEFLTRSIKTLVLLSLLSAFTEVTAQSVGYLKDASSFHNIRQDTQQVDQFPEPKKVLHRSLIIPGWGQVTNKQVWKVPIVYGLIGGLTYYSILLHQNYKDYRAAYYNLNPNTPDDFKFGPTPVYISPNADLNSLRDSRNFYRNRRDFIFITIGLAYALNAIDAYVFAHLRSFDVSDDLTMNTSLQPVYLSSVHREPLPGISISVKMNFK